MKTRNEKFRNRIATIVWIVFGLVVVADPAWAGDTFRFKDQSANAFFTSTDSSGCVLTDVSVFASENASVFHNPPGRPSRSSGSGAFIAITRFDDCNSFELLLAASCFNSDPLADSDFRVLGNLGSATLKTTLECFDSVSGDSFNVVVDLTMVGIGNAIRESSHSHYRSPGFVSHSRSSGIQRSAEASGSVSDGTSNFTPEPSDFAYIMSVKSGFLSIY